MGTVVGLDRAGNEAQVSLRCGYGPAGRRVPARSRWTVKLSSVSSFGVQANPPQGETVGLTRAQWVATVRRSGFTGSFDLRGKASSITNGPSTDLCAPR